MRWLVIIKVEIRVTELFAHKQNQIFHLLSTHNHTLLFKNNLSYRKKLYVINRITEQ